MSCETRSWCAVGGTRLGPGCAGNSGIIVIIAIRAMSDYLSSVRRYYRIYITAFRLTLVSKCDQPNSEYRKKFFVMVLTTSKHQRHITTQRWQSVRDRFDCTHNTELFPKYRNVLSSRIGSAVVTRLVNIISQRQSYFSIPKSHWHNRYRCVYLNSGGLGCTGLADKYNRTFDLHHHLQKPRRPRSVDGRNENLVVIQRRVVDVSAITNVIHENVPLQDTVTQREWKRVEQVSILILVIYW